MASDQIRYDLLIQQALRSMVRDLLADVAKKGLPGEHHFFITFDTLADGVKLSQRMRAQYPREMTIVLQHQFWDLAVFDDRFEVGLSFNGIPERLAIPLTAVKGFFDPSVQRHPALAGDMGFRELRGVMAALTPREAELAATARALLEWHRTHGFCAACGARSEVVQAGWQRQCPACNVQHFPRTDPVVIMLITRGNSVLMGRSPGWPEGMYSLLAGFIEPGETIEAAVRREVMEESGVRVGAVRYLASQPWPFPASLMLGCAGEAETDAIVLDPAELEDALWITREEMVSVMAGTHPRLKPPRRGAIAQFLMANWLADSLD